MVRGSIHDLPIAHASLDRKTKKRIWLFQNGIKVSQGAKMEQYPISEISAINIVPKKLIMPLVLGGIGTCFSMLAISMGWYHYQLNVLIIFFFFGLMYWGYIGRMALVIEMNKHTQVFLLKHVEDEVRNLVHLYKSRELNKHRPHKSYIYHLATKEDWESQLASMKYRHGSLDKEGFIHCSKLEELFKSYQLYLEDGKFVYLLILDVNQLDAEVNHEYVENRNNEFPHVMGEINKSAISYLTGFQNASELEELIRLMYTAQY